MAVIQNLYQIFKIPASFLVENDCNIKNYTISKGLKDGYIVSIGDNLVFQQIRYHYGNYDDHRKLFYNIQRIRNSAHYYKKQGQYKEARILNTRIVDKLFVKDIINVYIDKSKSDFHKFRVKGFDFNGIHYVYLCSGSGQIRRNTATFINEQLHDKIVSILNCGLDQKTSQFVLAKYSAYFALAFSSVLWVRTPRVCVIKDFYRTLKNENVDFICPDENGKSHIEERQMDLELNCADGQGLIDPQFAQLWSQDMDLSYTPCSFVARSCFIKGNLVTFDFKEYAKQHNITTIRDRWGDIKNIEDIDVLISESQFKVFKYYNSWKEYTDIAQKNDIHWGVARYSKKYDDDYVLANYQYIQSLSLDKDDIKKLIDPTVTWIQQICSGDPLYALLYCFGPKNEDISFQRIYGTAQTNFTKAIVKDINFLNDSYVQQKIYKSIAETINRAKIGKIWIRGNYQFMIADPLAQCQAALGLPPVGALKKDEIWCNYWQQINPDGCVVDCCRSPLIDQHEHNPMTVVTHNQEANYWYRHLYSGIIYNTYDTSCFRHSDSDYDGDIVLTTDNEQFLKGSHKDHNIITYDKGLATPAKMTVANITKTVMKGFGTGVGGFSNTATILYAMAAIFNKPEQKDMQEEIMTRIKLLREIVGQEIDRIKGADKPSLPPEWKEYETFSPEDSDEEKMRKARHNSLVISKKPYFFRYLYPELNKRFKQFENSYNQVSKDMFGIKFKKLFKKEDKTDEEKLLIKNYQRYSPLITSDCIMNCLCREIENIDFDIKFSRDTPFVALLNGTPIATQPLDKQQTKKKATSLLPTFEEEFKDSFDPQKYEIVKALYKTYNSRRQIKHLTAILESSVLPEEYSDFSEVRSSVYTSIIDDLQQQITKNSISGKEFLYYTSLLSKTTSSFNWGFAWDVLEDQIIKLIPQGETFIPVRWQQDPTTSSDSSPEISGYSQYLGNWYKLQRVIADEEHVEEIPTTLDGSADNEDEIKNNEDNIDQWT